MVWYGTAAVVAMGSTVGGGMGLGIRLLPYFCVVWYGTVAVVMGMRLLP